MKAHRYGVVLGGVLLVTLAAAPRPTPAEDHRAVGTLRQRLTERGSVQELEIEPAGTGLSIHFVGKVQMGAQAIDRARLASAQSTEVERDAASRAIALSALQELRTMLELGDAEYRGKSSPMNKVPTVTGWRTTAFQTYANGVLVERASGIVNTDRDGNVAMISGLFPRLTGTATDKPLVDAEQAVAALLGEMHLSEHQLARYAQASKDGKPFHADLVAVPGQAMPVWIVKSGYGYITARIDARTGAVLSKEILQPETPY